MASLQLIEIFCIESCHSMTKTYHVNEHLILKPLKLVKLSIALKKLKQKIPCKIVNLGNIILSSFKELKNYLAVELMISLFQLKSSFSSWTQ